MAQLRSLSKCMGQSGTALQRIEATVYSVVGSAVRKGADGERFRSEWSSTLRPMLRNSSDSLRDQAKSLLAHADEQERTSSGSSGGGSAGSAGGAASGSPLDPVLNPGLDANGNPVYQVANAAASGAGLGADVLLSQMNKAGLLTRMPWSVLGAQYGQAPGLGDLKGTQLLNGLSMVGRAAGVLSIIGGTAQFADGMLSGGDSNAMWDGGVSTVLAAGSFVPVGGPFFAGASLAWAGMGLLSKNLGYGSTSEMVVDGAKKVGSVIADTTLLVRGLAEVSGDDIVPVDKGAIVAAVVSTAEDWLEVALVTPETDHVLFTAGSKDGALLLNLNRYGVHEVQPVDPGAGMLQLGLQIARHYLETGAEGYPAAAMIKHHRLSGPPLTAHLKVEADQSWTLATGDDGADKTEAIDAADAFRRFESALTF